jgi:hypothetical protein
MREENGEGGNSPPSRDMVTNQELARSLRTLPSAEKAAWVKEHLAQDPLGAFDVAKRIGFRSEEARMIVESTIEFADASSIRWWVDFYASVAGLRRVLRLLDSWYETGYVERAGMAAYWVGSLPGASSPAGRELISKYRRKHRDAGSS